MVMVELEPVVVLDHLSASAYSSYAVKRRYETSRQPGLKQKIKTRESVEKCKKSVKMENSRNLVSAATVTAPHLSLSALSTRRSQ